MIHVDSLEKLFCKDSHNFKLKNIYTTTKHKNIVLAELNKVIKCYPEYYELIVLLSSYPLIKWARKQREKIKIDLNEFDRSLLSSNHEFIGIKFHGSRFIHRESLILSEEIINALEYIVYDSEFNTKILQAIHIANSEDVSEYIIKKYYKDIIVKVCEKYNDLVKNELDKLKSSTTFEDEDMKVALHNTDLLIKSMHKIKELSLKKYNHHDEIDYEELYKSLIKVINALKEVNDGTEIVEILLSYGNGISIYQIALNLGRSRNYVMSKLELGTELLSYLLFGISYKTILQSLSR